MLYTSRYSHELLIYYFFTIAVRDKLLQIIISNARSNIPSQKIT